MYRLMKNIDNLHRLFFIKQRPIFLDCQLTYISNVFINQQIIYYPTC